MQPPPELHATVRIYLPDGTQTHATWMGSYWWARDRQLQPDQVERWEPLTDRQITCGDRPADPPR